MRKIQLPAIGGIRKTITIPAATTPGTTIAEFGAGTITLAQLRAALSQPTPNTQVPANSTAGYLATGPGLTGGGVLSGALTLRLTEPVAAPLLVDEDEDADDTMMIPGPTGPPGPQGAPAPATFFLAEDPEDYEDENVVFVPLSL